MSMNRMYPDSGAATATSSGVRGGGCVCCSRSGQCGHGIISSITLSVSVAMRSTMWFTLIACEMWWMKNSSQPTQVSASTIAPSTVATGANGCGSERAAGNAAMQ